MVKTLRNTFITRYISFVMLLGFIIIAGNNSTKVIMAATLPDFTTLAISLAGHIHKYSNIHAA